jgi:hypothetical protein
MARIMPVCMERHDTTCHDTSMMLVDSTLEFLTPSVNAP